jgi:hypothetical protein
MWCATLALAALATRFAPPHPHGDWNVVNMSIDLAVGVLAVSVSVYVIVLLELVKRGTARAGRRRDQASRAA